MKFGMTEAQYRLLESLVIQPLKLAGCRIFIFGSRATGKNHPHSDVDLLYSHQNTLSPGLISGIKENIEESKFPFIVEIVSDSDLIDSYRPSVMASRIEL